MFLLFSSCPHYNCSYFIYIYQLTGDCNEVSGDTNQVLEHCNQVSGDKNQVLEHCNEVSGDTNQVLEHCNQVSGRHKSGTRTL